MGGKLRQIDPPEYDVRLLADARLVFRGRGTMLYRLRGGDAAKVGP